MLVDFDRVFHPTVDEQIEDLETALRIHKEAIEKKWCSTCKHWKAPPNNLPGFVEDHGHCDLKHTVDATPKCFDYELNKADEVHEYQKIKNKLDELMKSDQRRRFVIVENIEERKDCPMRHENGNCMVIGGFCIDAVSDEICHGLHNAYDKGLHDGAERMKKHLENLN